MESVINNGHLIPVLIREIMLITRVIHATESCQQVIFKAWNEVLRGHEVSGYENTLGNYTHLDFRVIMFTNPCEHIMQALGIL
jgi:hypothetical protein